MPRKMKYKKKFSKTQKTRKTRKIKRLRAKLRPFEKMRRCMVGGKNWGNCDTSSGLLISKTALRVTLGQLSWCFQTDHNQNNKQTD